MVHGRGGASRRLSFILLTTSAFGATSAVAPAQPVHALVLPRQQVDAAESDDAAQPAPAGADATRDAFAAALLSGDASARDAPRGLDAGLRSYDGTVSTEDNELVGTGWGAGSWSLGGLAQQPRELPPRAGPGVHHGARDAQPWAASLEGGEASTSDGDSSRIAASVLAAVMPAAAMLATEPGVASVGVHVSVTQESSVTPQHGGVVTLSRDWHVTASADVEVADAAAAAAAAEAMAWQTAAVMDPNVNIFSQLLPHRSLPDDASLLGETASERALGLVVLAMLWVFVGVFIGRHMYSEEDEEDDFVFDDVCCKSAAAASSAGASSPPTLNAAATRATAAVAREGSGAGAPLPRAAESAAFASQPLAPPPMPYSVA